MQSRPPKSGSKIQLSNPQKGMTHKQRQRRRMMMRREQQRGFQGTLLLRSAFTNGRLSAAGLYFDRGLLPQRR